MSKKTSKLSRKCANKREAQPLMDKYMNKSTDDFEDDTKHFTRNTIKTLNKDKKNNISQTTTKPKNYVRSGLQEFAVESCTNKPRDKENAFSQVSGSVEGRTQTQSIVSSHDRESNDTLSTNIIENRIGCRKTDDTIDNMKQLDFDDNKITKISKNDTIVPPCPLCGKEFRSCKDKRTAHLKECGSLHGIRTEDLIKVRRLEVKHL